MAYKRKEKVKCLECNEVSTVEIVFGENKQYPEEFYIKCPECDNWESGTLPIQGFTEVD